MGFSLFLKKCPDYWLEDILRDRAAVKLWQQKFQSVYDHRFDTWDFQWVFACWSQSGLAICPNINLVSNIGYGSDATHSKSIVSEFANIPTESMSFPLQHSKLMIRDAQADRYSQGSMIRLTRIRQIIANPLRFKLMLDNYRNSKNLADS